MKTKFTITLRQRPISNGNHSLYLDIYNNGKRSYEYLKLYLITEATQKDIEQNKNTLKIAQAMLEHKKLQIEQEIIHKLHNKVNITLSAFLNEIATNYKNTGKPSMYKSVKCIHALLLKYDKTITELNLNLIDKDWIENFQFYLTTIKLKHNTIKQYFSILKICFNIAKNKGIIDHNPTQTIKGYSLEETTRTYLTIAEIQKLSSTLCDNSEVKRAFLFSCLTGIRYSDIKNLQQHHIYKEHGFTRIIFNQQKTKGQEYLDITPQAAKLLNSSSNNANTIFNLPMAVSTLCRILAKWCKRAGIHKHITFHCARHSFATMMIELGTDIYTVSKLLGHRELSTTLIYAKVIDKLKQKAIKKIPLIL